MPVTGSRSLVYVDLSATFPLKYGFMTGVTAAVQTILGHVPVTDRASVSGLVIGANAPKPARATRVRASGVDSSFCDHGARAGAIAAGFKVGAPRRRFGNSGARSKTVYVVHEGNKIAWKMPNSTHTAIGADLTALGIVDATAADKDLVFGVSYPQLPRVKQTGSTIERTTFCDPSKLNALPTGWITTKASENF